MAQQGPDMNLINSFKRGQTGALAHVFNLFYLPLCYFAETLTDNKGESEDIVQDSFIKLWKMHAGFDSLPSIKAFLYVTTRNACFDYLKHTRRKNASHQELLYLAEEHEDYIQSKMIKAELLQRILEEVENLPPVRRKIFKMIFVEGLTNQEIAAKLNISVDTVRVQKARSLDLIRIAFLKKKLLAIGVFLGLLTR
jgi:RNA polymerase sigma-70 factor (family 1)